MKKIIALVLALALSLAAVSALAANATATDLAPVDKEGEYDAKCDRGADFSCKHGYNYGTQSYRNHNFPSYHDLDGLLSIKAVSTKSEQDLIKAIRKQGTLNFFGQAGDLTEVIAFQATVKDKAAFAKAESVVIELRTVNAPNTVREYTAMLELNGEWVEIPACVVGDNYIVDHDPKCPDANDPSKVMWKLLAYYQVELTHEQMDAILGTTAHIVLLSH